MVATIFTASENVVSVFCYRQKDVLLSGEFTNPLIKSVIFPVGWRVISVHITLVAFLKNILKSHS